MSSRSNASVPPAMPDVPLSLLNSVLPGFSVIRDLIIASLGIDITLAVSSLFVLAAFIGALTYAARAVSRNLFSFFSCTIQIDSKDALFEDVMEFISKNAMSATSRSLSAATRSSQWDELEPFLLEHVVPSTGEYFNFEDFDSLIPPRYVPAPGKSHNFYHKRRYFRFHRDEPTTDSSNSEKNEVLRLTCLGRSPDPLKALLLDIKRSSKQDKARMITIRHPSSNHRGGGWTTATKRPSRPMSTIYLDESVKQALLDDSAEFLLPTSPRFYARRGIPYRRGYLFHGLPGTGKTSLSFALAGVFGLTLHVLSLLEPTMNDQKLMQLFSQLPARCIVLLEDVDASGLSRETPRDQVVKDNKVENEGREKTTEEDEKESTNGKRRTIRPRGRPVVPDGEASGVTLSGLLNALDGVASQEGRILVMTTNLPENLDAALIRPGRVDRQIYFGNVSKDNVRHIFVRMFSTDDLRLGEDDGAPVVEGKGRAEGLRMADDFAAAIPEDALTPAEVQGFLLTRRKDPQKALADIGLWVEEMLIAKAEGKNIVAKDKTDQDVAPQSGR